MYINTLNNSLNIFQDFNFRPESQILINNVLSKQINGMVQPSKIELINFIGSIAGSEFLTYAVNKLYIALDMQFSISSGNDNIQANGDGINLFNENNVGSYFLNSQNVEFNVSQLYYINELKANDYYFSRILQQSNVYNFIKFNGIKLTY